MNEDRTLLGLELRLLIARHGKRQVSEALSAIGDVDVARVEEGIRAYENRKSRPRNRPGKTLAELVRDAHPKSVEAHRLIEKLGRAYENREFLASLREAGRFLESRGNPVRAFRSRADALPAVLRALALCDLEELQTLYDRRRDHRSDLGIITDQILGPANDSDTRV